MKIRTQERNWMLKHKRNVAEKKRQAKFDDDGVKASNHEDDVKHRQAEQRRRRQSMAFRRDESQRHRAMDEADAARAQDVEQKEKQIHAEERSDVREHRRREDHRRRMSLAFRRSERDRLATLAEGDVAIAEEEEAEERSTTAADREDVKAHRAREDQRRRMSLAFRRSERDRLATLTEGEEMAEVEADEEERATRAEEREDVKAHRAGEERDRRTSRAFRRQEGRRHRAIDDEARRDALCDERMERIIETEDREAMEADRDAQEEEEFVDHQLSIMETF